MKAAEASRFGAYVILCLMIGIRTEEARALRWDHVDLDGLSIAVWRSVRHCGDTKIAKSRRALGLPQAVVQALRDHRVERELQIRDGIWATVAVGSQLGFRLGYPASRESFARRRVNPLPRCERDPCVGGCV
jgi:integrase